MTSCSTAPSWAAAPSESPSLRLRSHVPGPGFTNEDAQERFGHLINAFKFGAPPHGGLAYGLDRLCMLMAGAESIRDVIAFPKVQNASEPMTQCPDFVDDKQLEELSINVTRKEAPEENA